ncbi:hypothetical protein KKG22_05030 [Patescibacteria group bacterium]|nr:hypothetical protein [Patescibacteria group bacterium]MBU1721698.1 hypothetical protein [Patescibacteria group bacterium]MBU1901451.1 hypothetical protein [Patescibacteria group bacterium]
MNYIKDNKVLYWIVRITDNLVSFFIFATILVVIFFMAIQVYRVGVLFPNVEFSQVLYMVAMVLILVKAYRLLLFYMESHHVSIKYIVEIAIIAPAVELIFVPMQQTVFVNILYALFSVGHLIIYIWFYNALSAIDKECVEEECHG